MSQLSHQTVAQAKQMGDEQEQQTVYLLTQQITQALLIQNVNHSCNTLENLQASTAISAMKLSAKLVDLEAHKELQQQQRPAEETTTINKVSLF